MADKPDTRHIFPSAAEDVEHAGLSGSADDSYRLAFNDDQFLLRDELRAVRLQLEWLKPDLIQEELGIKSTVVIFGGARFPDPESARNLLRTVTTELAQNPEDPVLIKKHRRADTIARNSRYYLFARSLATKITEASLKRGGDEFVVVTGGGPGVMEAANRGAMDAGGKSIGLNIVLPHEQQPNAYITPELRFQFHYFALRKMHFLKRARALITFPGGFGTLDELFETLTLIRTGKIKQVPVILVGEKYWTKLVNFDFLVEQGAINEADLDLFSIVDGADDAWTILKKNWAI